MDNFRYNDIVNMHYPNADVEKDFPSDVLRAAQFAPFAALTGYDDAVEEAARQTNTKTELDEYEIEIINNKLLYMKDHPEVVYSITYFVPDSRKQGGKYVTYKGKISKIKEYEKIIVTENQQEIPINDIREVQY